MDYNNRIIKEVVIVEGYHDLSKLKSIYPKIDCIITNGSEIKQETLKELKQLNKERGLILFLDPDFQGERIRRIINTYVGETKHAFLNKKDCFNKNKTKVGIEHANKKAIEEALESVYSEIPTSSNRISKQDLYELKLVGNPHAKTRRKRVCNELNIGLCNAKTLQKKLNMFAIQKSKIIDILKT